MSEMSKLSEPREESNGLHTEVDGWQMLPSADEGRRHKREEEGPMEEEEAQPMAEPWGAARPGRAPHLEGKEFDDWEDGCDYYPEEEQLSSAGYRVSTALEEANKIFLRTSKAKEASLDGGFQMHYEKTLFDQLAFIEGLFSFMVVNRLTKELGRDEITDRELHISQKDEQT
uniref:EP300 interacting inhibitor of differentiation 1 n=1 Tax=Loxodonta africana TaxID=9785 RepID=G3U1W3_LOXAF